MKIQNRGVRHAQLAERAEKGIHLLGEIIRYIQVTDNFGENGQPRHVEPRV